MFQTTNQLLMGWFEANYGAMFDNFQLWRIDEVSLLTPVDSKQL